ncbi:hypothetical protein [Halomonas binhaiensis]|uniref:Uncharacterized protein n=1 Tax=Halomonas binhaiensis TaxID=2562282 RepID=A0A7U3HWP9_9GAMM|nr:hypothetical protein [Halomonas binhaiensis]QRG26791.1 hypothetical protein E4T21_21370 [Halomonas binhaiensis]
MAAGLYWLLPRTPWMSEMSWADAWPPLAIGAGVMFLAMVGIRLVAELWMLPYYLADSRQGFSPADVVTRSYERRPAVHNTEQSWTAPSRIIEDDGACVSDARVTRPAESLVSRRDKEPELDLNKAAETIAEDGPGTPRGPDTNGGPGAKGDLNASGGPGAKGGPNASGGPSAKGGPNASGGPGAKGGPNASGVPGAKGPNANAGPGAKGGPGVKSGPGARRGPRQEPSL